MRSDSSGEWGSISMAFDPNRACHGETWPVLPTGAQAAGVDVSTFRSASETHPSTSATLRTSV